MCLINNSANSYGLFLGIQVRFFLFKMCWLFLRKKDNMYILYLQLLFSTISSPMTFFTMSYFQIWRKTFIFYHEFWEFSPNRGALSYLSSQHIKISNSQYSFLARKISWFQAAASWENNQSQNALSQSELVRPSTRGRIRRISFDTFVTPLLLILITAITLVLIALLGDV